MKNLTLCYKFTSNSVSSRHYNCKNERYRLQEMNIKATSIRPWLKMSNWSKEFNSWKWRSVNCNCKRKVKHMKGIAWRKNWGKKTFKYKDLKMLIPYSSKGFNSLKKSTSMPVPAIDLKVSIALRWHLLNLSQVTSMCHVMRSINSWADHSNHANGMKWMTLCFRLLSLASHRVGEPNHQPQTRSLWSGTRLRYPTTWEIMM